MLTLLEVYDMQLRSEERMNPKRKPVNLSAARERTPQSHLLTTVVCSVARVPALTFLAPRSCGLGM